MDDFGNYYYIFDDDFCEEMVKKAYIMHIFIAKIITKSKLLCERQRELTLINKLLPSLVDAEIVIKYIRLFCGRRL